MLTFVDKSGLPLLAAFGTGSARPGPVQFRCHSVNDRGHSSFRVPSSRLWWFSVALHFGFFGINLPLKCPNQPRQQVVLLSGFLDNA